ncbi:MAG: hypothetical protein ABIG68_08105, partial [Acidobacteriota bacterium]
ALAGILFLVCGSPAQEQSVLLRYDLKPGDHLFYRQTFKREAVGGQTAFGTIASWDNHVLVAGEQSWSPTLAYSAALAFDVER